MTQPTIVTRYWTPAATQPLLQALTLYHREMYDLFMYTRNGCNDYGKWMHMLRTPGSVQPAPRLEDFIPVDFFFWLPACTHIFFWGIQRVRIYFNNQDDVLANMEVVADAYDEVTVQRDIVRLPTPEGQAHFDLYNYKLRWLSDLYFSLMENHSDYV